jgi:acyl-CoA dehydrogenase
MSESMIEQSAARLFTENVNRQLIEQCEAGDFPHALWELVEDSGFTHALVPESAGGIGLSFEAAFPILSGLGSSAVPLPLAETMVGAFVLAMAGVEIPSGPMTLIDSVQISNAEGRTQGRAVHVPWARHCPWAVSSLSDGRMALFDLSNKAEVEIHHGQDLAGMPSDQILFHACKAHAIFDNPLPSLRWPLRVLGATARSAMMVGALGWLLEQSVQYANDRVQFGRPIGRNQAIQQQLALMAGDVAAARIAAMLAAKDAPWAENTDTSATLFSTAVAKIRVGEAATQGASIAHQVHGAMGFTHEHMLHFATRRLWAWRESFGSEAWWAQRLGSAAISAGGGQFWPSVTRKAFDEDLLAAAAASRP